MLVGLPHPWPPTDGAPNDGYHPQDCGHRFLRRLHPRCLDDFVRIRHDLLFFCPATGASHASVRFALRICNLFNRCSLCLPRKPANASPRVRPSNLRTVNQLHGVWRGRVKGFQPFHQLMPMAARNSTRHKLIWSLLSLSRQSIRICAYRGPHAGRCPSLMLLSSQAAWPYRNHSDGNMIMLMHIVQ
jgi:hypothetical protein